MLNNVSFASEVYELSGKPFNVEGTIHKLGLRMSADKTEQMKWTDCLVAVRDTQDKAEFSNLFCHFAPRVKSFLMKGGANAHQAEEIAQEAMVTVWHKAHLFNPERASASTWIFTVARNKRIDALRKERRPEPEELPWGYEQEPDAADCYQLQEETAQLFKEVNNLPSKQREIVKRAFYGDLTHQEIAEQTGLPLGTIKSRIRLALERLRRNMK